MEYASDGQSWMKKKYSHKKGWKWKQRDREKKRKKTPKLPKLNDVLVGVKRCHLKRIRAVILDTGWCVQPSKHMAYEWKWSGVGIYNTAYSKSITTKLNRIHPFIYHYLDARSLHHSVFHFHVLLLHAHINKYIIRVLLLVLVYVGFFLI